MSDDREGSSGPSDGDRIDGQVPERASASFASVVDGAVGRGFDPATAALRSAAPRHRRDGLSGIEIAAGALSLLWIVVVTLVIVFARTDASDRPFDPIRFIMTLMAVFLPIAVIWVGAVAAKSAQVMRDESTRLQAAIDAIRHTYITQLQSGQGRQGVEKKLDEIVQAQRKTEAAIATFASIRAHQIEPPPEQQGLPASGKDDQPSLALNMPSEGQSRPLAAADFVRALNFPETAEDADGFRALRRALRDRPTGLLIQASQDVLTLLSQDGIYMDDLTPDRARPDVWRRFAQGERGRAISALGGVHDRSSLALAAGRMHSDTIFRDAVHHFLRKFDQTLAAFEPHATDAEIVALADTRTARAFMLLGRVTGTFD